MLVRGFIGYRSAGRITGTSVSRIASLAVGEVLVSGAAEPIELTLVSPLQSAPCVYYRSRITEASDGDGRDVFREERAVGFRVRDASGAVASFRAAPGSMFPTATTRAPGPGAAARSGSCPGPGPSSPLGRTIGRRRSRPS